MLTHERCAFFFWQCNATNFSRRTTCFKCFVPKGEHPREVPADFSLARGSPDARHAPPNDSEYYRQHDDRSRDRYDSREGGYSRSPESRGHGSYPSERDAAAPQSNVIAVRQLPFDVDEGQVRPACVLCGTRGGECLTRDTRWHSSKWPSRPLLASAPSVWSAIVLQTSRAGSPSSSLSTSTYAEDGYLPERLRRARVSDVLLHCGPTGRAPSDRDGSEPAGRRRFRPPLVRLRHVPPTRTSARGWRRPFWCLRERLPQSARRPRAVELNRRDGAGAGAVGTGQRLPTQWCASERRRQCRRLSAGEYLFSFRLL